MLEKKLGPSQLLCGFEADQFVSDGGDVLAVSLDLTINGILAPALRDDPRVLSVCVARLHAADSKRNGFEKWLGLVARMTRIKQSKLCHTLIEAGRTTNLGAIRQWMQEMRGEIPDGLKAPMTAFYAGGHEDVERGN